MQQAVCTNYGGNRGAAVRIVSRTTQALLSCASLHTRTSMRLRLWHRLFSRLHRAERCDAARFRRMAAMALPRGLQQLSECRIAATPAGRERTARRCVPRPWLVAIPARRRTRIRTDHRSVRARTRTARLWTNRRSPTTAIRTTAECTHRRLTNHDPRIPDMRGPQRGDRPPWPPDAAALLDCRRRGNYAIACSATRTMCRSSAATESRQARRM